MGNTWATVETSKSPTGVAKIKVGSKKVKVTFDDGSVDKIFHKDDLPEYPVKLTSGKYFVALSGDKTEVTRIGPANTGAPITVRCVDFVRPEEGSDPEPKEYENKKRHYSYQAFTVLLEVQDGVFRKCQIPMFLGYKFADDGTGMAAFAGNPEKGFRTAQLMEFLEFTGATDEPMEYSDNILPELLVRIKNAKRDFQVIVKNGYVESMLRADDYIEEEEVEDLDDDNLDDELDVEKDFPKDEEELEDDDEFVEDEDL